MDGGGKNNGGGRIKRDRRGSEGMSVIAATPLCLWRDTDSPHSTPIPPLTTFTAEEALCVNNGGLITSTRSVVSDMQLQGWAIGK